MVKGLNNGRARGAVGIRAEHIKGWLRNMEREEKEEHGNEGVGDAWRKFVKFIHAIWETWSVLQQMTWTVIVLLSNEGGDYMGIEPLDPLWKYIEVIMHNILKTLNYHDCLAF